MQHCCTAKKEDFSVWKKHRAVVYNNMYNRVVAAARMYSTLVEPLIRGGRAPASQTESHEEASRPLSHTHTRCYLFVCEVVGICVRTLMIKKIEARLFYLVCVITLTAALLSLSQLYCCCYCCYCCVATHTYIYKLFIRHSCPSLLSEFG